MKAVILAGGYGKRLRPLTDTMPKPLIEVAGKPIIEWQILWLRKCGIRSFVILSGYLKEKLVSHLNEKKALLDIEVEYSHEEEPLGTGGALKKAEPFFKNEKEFAVFNGDNITNIDIRQMKLKDKELATIAVVPLRSTYGITVIENEKIVAFKEKPMLSEYWMNAGIYVMSTKIFSRIPQKGALETTTFVELAKAGMLGASKFKDAYFKGIDSIKDRDEADSYLRENNIYG